MEVLQSVVIIVAQLYPAHITGGTTIHQDYTM